MTKDQAKQQIADAIACKTAMLIAAGWEPVGEWTRDDTADILRAGFKRPVNVRGSINWELRQEELRLSEVPDLADKWNKRGNRAARRKRAAIARKR